MNLITIFIAVLKVVLYNHSQGLGWLEYMSLQDRTCFSLVASCMVNAKCILSFVVLCFRFLYGDQARFFQDEIHLDLKHAKKGTIAMASAGENLNASQVLLELILYFW